MTKAEAIRKAGYEEEDLISLAILMAYRQAKEWKNSAEDSESWEHYEALETAFNLIYEERLSAKKEA